MIDLLLKDNKKFNLQSVDEIVDEKLDFSIIQFHDYTPADIEWLKKNFNLDFAIMSHYEDIEISSHFLEQESQISFHFSIPYYNMEKRMIEEHVFFIIASNRLFFLTSSMLDEFMTEIYANKLSDMLKPDDMDIATLPLEFISDYYADITEDLAKKIKAIAAKILVDNAFSDKEMNFITRYSFNNLLIKEAVNEALRIFNLCRRSHFGKSEAVKDIIDTEQNDLMVVSDYIQFNLERLRDLKDHINNKINIEQNRIFQILTIATICIALPTLVAGIYGMNFDVMPELHWPFGYALSMLAIILCALLPYLYFKKKKWLQ
jgi:magnesium transporter